MTTPTLALVGCGAIADAFHLPALQRRPDLAKSLILVDRDLARARAVQERLGAAAAVDDYRTIIGDVQGAIVATPHHLHRQITLDFVRAGKHVLSEKPLAETGAEVDEIVAAAERHGVQVAVNHTRRLFSSFQAIQREATTGGLGELREIGYVLGEPFAWPAATDSYFGAKHGARGVLFDTGAHIVDLVCWFLGGEPELTDYQDDSHGGTEAVARLTLKRGTATARIHLSWLSKLRNQFRLVGSAATITGGVYEWSSYTRRDANGRTRTVRTDQARTFEDFADMLITNFADVVAGRAAPIVAARDVRASVAVIDACYARRKRFAEPWHDACTRLAHA